MQRARVCVEFIVGFRSIKYFAGILVYAEWMPSGSGRDTCAGHNHIGGTKYNGAAVHSFSTCLSEGHYAEKC